MPYCPNPECTYRKRHREAAEFIPGTSVCSDCETPLSHEDVLGRAGEAKTSGRTFVLTDFHKRLLWTLVLAGSWKILSYLSLPGINLDALSILPEEMSRQWTPSVMSLGLMPFVFSYILVEILALFVPPLKRWREDAGPEGRTRLLQTAKWLTLFLAAYQGIIMIAPWGRSEIPLLIYSGWFFQAVMVTTLVAGTFLSLWFADMISRKGIGHGISILLLMFYLDGLPGGIRELAKVRARTGDSFLYYFGLPLLAIIALIVLIVLAEKAHKKLLVQFPNNITAYLPIKLTTAGTVPSDWGSAFISVPILLAVYYGADLSNLPTLQWVATNFYGGSFFWNIAYALVVFILYYAFTNFFYNTVSIRRFLLERTTGAVSEDAMTSFGRGLKQRSIFGALYLVFAWLFLVTLWRVAGLPISLDGISLIVIVAIALDLVTEVQARWKGELFVKIAEHQKPWKAGLLQSLLQQHDIPSLTRGYYHRALMYFFGPYVEISTYVPADKQGAAEGVMKEYWRKA